MGHFQDTAFLLRLALRQAICEALNRHQRGDAPDIALVGSRRSGSTLLMQIIAHQPGMKSVNQPFALHTSTTAQMRHLGWPPGGVLVSDRGQTRERVLRYIEAMREGRLHVREPWRFWRKDFHFRTDRLVLKTTQATFLLDLLREAGLTILLYFRHPVPHALSCQRNQMPDKVDIFAETRSVADNYLDDRQRTLLFKMVKQEPYSLERYVLGWCIENQPLFAALAEGMPAVFYEDLVLRPEECLTHISKVCGLEESDDMREMLRQPSISVKGLSEKSTSRAIRSGDTAALVGRWVDQIDTATSGRLQEILGCFPACPYLIKSPTPVRNSF